MALIIASLGIFLCIRRRKQRALKAQLHPPPLSPPRPQPQPQPPRPQRPLPPPPPPPPKNMRAWLASPSPTPSDRKELMYHKPKSRNTAKSTFNSTKGPFELPCRGADEKDRQLYELYGEWPSDGSPDSMGHHHHHHHTVSSPTKLVTKSADPLRSHPASPHPPAPIARKGSFTSPPPSYCSQPAELYSPPQGVGSPYRHRRMPSERWGTSWAPAELDGGGYM